MKSVRTSWAGYGAKFFGLGLLCVSSILFVGCSSEQDNKTVAKKQDGKRVVSKQINKQTTVNNSNNNLSVKVAEAQHDHSSSKHQHSSKSQQGDNFAGRYTTIASNIRNRAIIKNNKKKDKIVVVEFFNYGCPACNAIEPSLEKWKNSLGNNVEFTRVPVVFHAGWLPLAKAYYAAEQLNIQDKVSPALFAAIHKKKENLANKKSLQAFFKMYDVNPKKFTNAYDSFYTDRSLERGRMLMTLFGIYSIPTIVINDTYKTDVRKAGGNPKQFISVLNYLIKKAEVENKKKTQGNG